MAPFGYSLRKDLNLNQFLARKIVTLNCACHLKEMKFANFGLYRAVEQTLLPPQSSRSKMNSIFRGHRFGNSELNFGQISIFSSFGLNSQDWDSLNECSFIASRARFLDPNYNLLHRTFQRHVSLNCFQLGSND